MRITSGNPHEGQIGFCRAVRVGNRVLISGTPPLFPDGSLPSDPALQARRCLEIIGEALAQAGASFQDVVRTRMYLTDRGDAWTVGKVHGEFLGAVQPTSTIVVVKGLLHPDWKVEIEAEAEIA